MPVITSPTYISRVYRSPSQLYARHQGLFKAYPEQFNIMYSQILRMIAREVSDQLTGTHVWITCGTEVSSKTPDFVLACSETPLGKLPIFIASPHPLTQLEDRAFVVPRLRSLITCLRENARVNDARVFSVFAPSPVSRAFAELWTLQTGIPCEPGPCYYSATYTRCTSKTFRNYSYTIRGDIKYDLRLALPKDLTAVARLCYEFALHSEPFVLTEDKALDEAALLISHGQVWVHTVKFDNQEEEIASIVAVARENTAVSAITKVYTNPEFRGKRCAERLVRHVCKVLLQTPGKQSVVLYVAHDNPAAQKVYHRVGFIGLNPSNSGTNDGGEDWLEIGFSRDHVELGHW